MMSTSLLLAKKGKTRMYNTLTKLIKYHYYPTREAVEAKMDACFALNRITEGEYAKLIMLLDEYYPIEEVSEE